MTDRLWFIRESFVVLWDLLVSDIISVHLAAGHEDRFWLLDHTPAQLTPLVPMTQADTFQVIGSWDRSLCHPWKLTGGWYVPFGCLALETG